VYGAHRKPRPVGRVCFADGDVLFETTAHGGGRLVCACALQARPRNAISAATLTQKLTTQTGKLGPASGAYVVDVDAGVELFSHRADLTLSPASNEKLFTTSTALLRFGPTATLKTSAAPPRRRDQRRRRARTATSNLVAAAIPRSTMSH